MSFTISPLGDEALLLDYGQVMDEAVNRMVLQLFQQLRSARLPFVTDLVPAYSSLAVFYDSHAVRQHHSGPAYDTIAQLVQQQVAVRQQAAELPARQHRIPVCYAPQFGCDLEEVAALKRLSVQEIIDIHTAARYRVYMIGFLPGFAYMGRLDDRIATPRRASPREKVAAGSVGIAGHQTGIYPLPSPGGWQIIGRTPLPVFDREAPMPALLSPNDEITFYPITAHEFESYPGRRA